MTMMHTRLLAVIMAALAGACSGGGTTEKDGSTPKEATTTDSTTGLPDGYGSLWPCEEPGKSCNAHDPCAVNAICSNSKLCIPSGLQNCDDGLTCTQDLCQGMGLCQNVPQAGMCALPVKIDASDAGAGSTVMRCFKKDDPHPSDPCLLCDPDTDPTKWTPANGGTCDDGDDCTKDDYCQLGVCKGVSYLTQCADAYGCTEDLCDGKGGCLGNQLKSDYCLINGMCHKDQEMNPNGTCGVCDVKSSQSQWTTVSNTCLIANKCYNVGSKHPTGDCATCDTTASKTAWTPSGNGCLISDVCYKTGVKDTIQCSECDPTKSTTAWTPLTGKCKIDGKCYAQAATHPGGCAECDTAISSTTWTVKTAQCLIANVCKNPGDKDTVNCSQCDPTSNKYDWTPLAGLCKIQGKCYTDKAVDATGCLTCAYATSPNQWTPVTGASAVSYNFDAGVSTGWTLTGTDATVKWQVSTKRPLSGNYSLYYGDPVAGNYAGAGTNSGSATMPAIQLTAAKKAGITFSLWMDTEASTSYDKLTVSVNNTVVWTKNSTQTITMSTWQPVTINLSTYAGQSVTIKFNFDTSDSVLNSTEGVHIDDITLYHDC